MFKHISVYTHLYYVVLNILKVHVNQTWNISKQRKCGVTLQVTSMTPQDVVLEGKGQWGGTIPIFPVA